MCDVPGGVVLAFINKIKILGESHVNTATYKVDGMTCGHCVAAVTSEVGGLADVSDVRVDLVGGLVTVQSGAPLAFDAVQAAVEEAGYTLVASV